jgi:hypothetical protein
LTIAAAGTAGAGGTDHGRPPIDFVEVGPPPSGDPDETTLATPLEPLGGVPAEPGWSLWGDAEI